MNPSEYWINRSRDNLVTSEQISNSNIPKLTDIYNIALRNTQDAIDSIYKNYSKKVGSVNVLDLQQLKAAVGKSDITDFKKAIAEAAKKLNIDINQAYDERYLQRLNRLQLLKEQIKLEIRSVAPNVNDILDQNFTNVIKVSYKTQVNDLKELNISVGSANLNKDIVNSILNSKFTDKSYSGRIWGNTKDLANVVQKQVGAALLSGAPLEKTARLLRDQFDVGISDTTRLVRTETNYYHNQADLQSYQDNGVEKYDFLTDLEPCPECQAVEAGNPYLLSDQEVSVNAPPIHPNCRCTTVAHIDDTQSANPNPDTSNSANQNSDAQA